MLLRIKNADLYRLGKKNILRMKHSTRTLNSTKPGINCLFCNGVFVMLVCAVYVHIDLKKCVHTLFIEADGSVSSDSLCGRTAS